MRRAKQWTCRGCGTAWPRTKQLCTCGRRRPPAHKPKHMVALEMPYESYIELNGGERCGICLRPRSDTDRRRLDRDHDHKTGRPRGLLCHKCNRALAAWVTPEWLRAAADYMERTA